MSVENDNETKPAQPQQGFSTVRVKWENHKTHPKRLTCQEGKELNNSALCDVSEMMLTMHRGLQIDPGPWEEPALLPRTRLRTSDCWRSTDPLWTKARGHILNRCCKHRVHPNSLPRSIRQANLSASLSTSSSSTSNCRFVWLNGRVTYKRETGETLGINQFLWYIRRSVFSPTENHPDPEKMTWWQQRQNIEKSHYTLQRPLWCADIVLILVDIFL